MRHTADARHAQQPALKQANSLSCITKHVPAKTHCTTINQVVAVLSIVSESQAHTLSKDLCHGLQATCRLIQHIVNWYVLGAAAAAAA
jgi:uncharacterized membrane protein YraQ (UPF0718 family)